MAKRSDGSFERIARDFYPTPREPVLDLSPFLGDVDGFCEPCVGDGALANVLIDLGHHMVYSCDIEPMGEAILYADERDAMSITLDECRERGISYFITNPPWPGKHGRGEPTLALIRHLASLRPTWMLLAADFAHNGYAAEVLAYCSDIVSVGRVKWITGTENTGKDNAAWFRFDHCWVGPTRFHGRGDRKPAYAGEIEGLL